MGFYTGAEHPDVKSVIHKTFMEGVETVAEHPNVKSFIHEAVMGGVEIVAHTFDVSP